MEYKYIDIHGKQYLPVSERVRMAHDSGNLVTIDTEVLSNNPVVIKATISLSGEKNGYPYKKFTGISAANPSKYIEKMSPYEVAETSAVGRALGFAGFGIEESIASADEIIKATTGQTEGNKSMIKPTKGKITLPDNPPFNE